jgi:polyisoprenoid-binding protein YceI
MFKHITIKYQIMKRITLSIMALAIAGTLFANAPKKSEAFKVDASKSSVTWLAKKVTGQHNGKVVLENGTLTVSNDKIIGGKFEIDMTSIEVLDLQGEWKDKLVGHLKSDDFFSVAKNPKSNFEITSVETKADGTTITGKLTIKGITKEITFPASVSKKGNVVVAIATIRIDRTKFDIKYGSKSFIEGIGDKAIDDEFEMQVNLVAMK